ncbi:hypothetical protein [Breoghania sp.]|uniref:hypothetical protein n=1 Tax=Breoghania sp. TaxID=2065378 RepID=UPI0026108D22|nr:hypothetical protein [Breoghania sp.]MDJ0933672.1 hypothetical protein [Breoghania sp.]
MPPLPPAAKPVLNETPEIVSDAAAAVTLAEAETAEVPVMAFSASGEAVATTATVSNEADATTTAFESSGEELFASGSAWRATEASAPFLALFRTEQTSADERFDDTFVSAFRARSEGLQAAVEANTVSSSNTETSEEVQVTDASTTSVPGTRPDGQPFDLTGFLKYRIFKEPEDLVPPA